MANKETATACIDIAFYMEHMAHAFGIYMGRKFLNSTA